MLNSIMKDLKVNIFDGKQMLIIIAMPVVLTVILSFALGGSFSPAGLDEPVKVAIVKQYETLLSYDDVLNGIDEIKNLPASAVEAYKNSMASIDPESIFFDEFLDSDDIRGILQYEIMSEEAAQEALDELSVSAIIYIPENFIIATYSNMFGYKEKVELEIVADASSSYRGEIVRQVISAFSDSLSMHLANGEVFNEISQKYLTQQEIMQKAGLFHENLSKLTLNARIEIKTETVEQYELIDSFTYYTAAMLCMFMLFSAGIGGRSMLEEKENLTYYRMKVLGVTYFQMMMSKMVVVLIICLLQSVVMIGLSSVFFNVDWGNYLTVALIALCGSFAIGGLGSFIGAISLRSGNYKLANAFEGAIVQVLALLGGSYIPLSVLPKFFTKISKFTVNGQALSAYIKTAQGMEISNIISEILIILLFGAIFFVAAWLLISSEGKKENA